MVKTIMITGAAYKKSGKKVMIDGIEYEKINGKWYQLSEHPFPPHHKFGTKPKKWKY
jgi:hypothetical protein